MPVDRTKIKDALDSFEQDDFIRAKETIKAEIHNSIQDYYKTKLDLQKDLEPKQAETPPSEPSETNAE